MSTLLLNSPAGHASRAFVDQKTARLDQVPLLVDHHHLAETETFHQQASGTTQKNTEQMLGICSVSATKKIANICSVFARYFDKANTKGIKQATGIPKKYRANVRYLLGILTRREREARTR